VQEILQNEEDANKWLNNLRTTEARIRLANEDEKENIADEIVMAVEALKKITKERLAAQHQLKLITQNELEAAKLAEYYASKMDREKQALEKEEKYLAETKANLMNVEEEQQIIGEQIELAKKRIDKIKAEAAEATHKAKKLIELEKKERREVQSTLQKLVGEEADAVKEAFDLAKELKNA